MYLGWYVKSKCGLDWNLSGLRCDDWGWIGWRREKG